MDYTDIRRLINQAANQGVNPSGTAQSISEGMANLAQLVSQGGITPSAPAVPAVPAVPAAHNVGAEYTHTSNPLHAAQQFLRFIAANRQPSLWGQIPAGTISEAARHNRASENLQRQVLQETARSNRAAETMQQLASMLPASAGERTNMAASAMLSGLQQLYNESYKHHFPIEQDMVGAVRPTPDYDSQILLTADALKRFVSDPNIAVEMTAQGVDESSLYDRFTSSQLSLSLPQFIAKLRELSPEGENDPLAQLLESKLPENMRVLGY